MACLNYLYDAIDVLIDNDWSIDQDGNRLVPDSVINKIRQEYIRVNDAVMARQKPPEKSNFKEAFLNIKKSVFGDSK